ncbi:MAG: hypothetical protein KGJ58_04650 [Patescibacteria group bacterium]|nr:hypothetical protein [Patescibacteria group bacterium]MDE1988714.1 hypothetical protein [Patescibacteria group bacterium]MDE2218699.1 hypothetical protein [Patescibacteria group bacterium]
MNTLIPRELIAKSIFENAIKSAGQISGYLDASQIEKKKSITSIIGFEFMYLFLHLISREFYSWYGKDFRKNELTKLSPIVISPTIETLYGNQSQEVKAKMINVFYDDLNTRELEYGICKELLIKNQEFSGNAVLTLFAKKIAVIMESVSNPEIITRSIELAISSWTQIRSLLPAPTGLTAK